MQARPPRHTMLLCSTLCATLFTSGCFWPGHMMRDSSFSRRNEAVQWVFSTGGQLQFTLRPHLFNLLCIPLPIKNDVTLLQPGARLFGSHAPCVVITEDYNGQYGGFALWRHLVALDLTTGRTVLANRMGTECTCSGWGHEEVLDGSTFIDIGGGWRLCYRSPAEQRGLYVGRQFEEQESLTELLVFAKGEGFDSLRKAHVLYFPEEKFAVIGTGEGFVICINLAKIEEQRASLKADALE